MLGLTCSGKTTILQRYVHKKFDQKKIATTGVDFSSVRYRSDAGEDCRVKIWDTAGQEKFRQLTKRFLMDAAGIIIVFNLGNREDFLKTRDLIDSV